MSCKKLGYLNIIDFVVIMLVLPTEKYPNLL